MCAPHWAISGRSRTRCCTATCSPRRPGSGERDPRGCRPPATGVHDHAAGTLGPRGVARAAVCGAQRAARSRGAPVVLRGFGSAEARLHLAEQQLATHRSRLRAFEEGSARAHATTTSMGQRTIEQWRRETLRLGLLYEHAAVDFWAGVVEDARGRSRPRVVARRSGARGPSAIAANTPRLHAPHGRRVDDPPWTSTRW